MKVTDVDQGYSWIVLTFCGINYLIVAGSAKSFGVLYTELLDYYEAGAGNTAWISSLCLLLFMGLGPISNFLGELYTYRVVMVIGGILVLIGYTASAFVKKMELLYLTYGIVAGIGYGFIFAPCTTIISFYFEKRRGLANGLMVSFSGFGSLGFPYMYRALIDYYGLHGALLIIGALFFHTCAVSLFLRQPPQMVKKKIPNEDEIELKPKGDVSQGKKPKGFLQEARNRMFRFDLFRNPKCTLLFLAIFLQTANFSANLVAIPGQVHSLDLGKQTITIAVSLVGASEIVSRAFLGWFADLNIISRPKIFMVCSGVSTVIGFVIPHLPYKEAVLVYSVLVGAFSGSFWSLMGVLMVDTVGLANFSPAFGLLSVTCACAIFLSQPSAGWLEDATGNWDLSFRFAGVLSALSFLLCLCQPLIIKWWCCHQENLENGEVMEKTTDIVEKPADQSEEKVLLYESVS